MVPIKTNRVKITSNYGKRSYKYQGKIVNDFHHGIDLIGGSDTQNKTYWWLLHFILSFKIW